MNTKQIIVIGAGRFGASFAKEAELLGHQVVLIDINKDRIDSLADEVTHAVAGDVRIEESLDSLGISNFDIAVVAIASDYQASVMATIVCKEMGISTIVAKARDELHAKVLKKIGATKTVFPERDSALRLAHSITNRNIMDFITLSDEYDLVEVLPLQKWIGRSIIENDIQKKYGLNIIAIKEGDDVILNPERDHMIKANSILTILAHKKNIQKFEQIENA